MRVSVDPSPVRSPYARIGVALAVGVLGALSVAVLDQQAAGAAPVAAEDATGADVLSAPLAEGETIPAEPDFGTTKVTAQVLPVEGTYSGEDLSGVIFTLTGTVDPTETDTCVTDLYGACDLGPVDGSQTYTLIATASESPDSPRLFPLPLAQDVIVGLCVVPPSQSDGDTECGGPFDGGDDNEFEFQVRGPNRQVDLNLTSTVTFDPELANDPSLPPFVTGLLPDAEFQVEAADAPDQASIDAQDVAADDDGVLPAVGVTNVNGTLTFTDGGETILFPPGSYVLTQLSATPGYVPIDGPIPFEVEDPTTLDEALTPEVVDLQNAPDIAGPVLVPDTYSTVGYGEIPLDVLLNDQLFGADAYILGVTSVNGSSVRVGAAPGCALPAEECEQVIYYTPAAGLLGPDVLQYLVATRGGTAMSTATVTVSVLTPAVVTAAPILPATGPQHVVNEFGAGVALLAAGAGLALAGSRRRSRV